MIKTWVIRIEILLAIAFTVFFVSDVIIDPDEPDFCSLCNSAPFHAPCLLNIETGNLTELKIYEPHPVKVAELASEQRGGYFGISMSGGVTVMSDPDAQTAIARIPNAKARLNKSEFCTDCRKLLADSERSYVLIDAYDLENIIKYEIVDGICCEMRCYTVSALVSGNSNTLEIMVSGTYR